VSTVQGLGTATYVSSASLISSIQGLGRAGYLSTVQASFFVSTVQGLGLTGFVSSASLTSTIQGLGASGYLSTVQPSFFVSTVQGLGTAGYISSPNVLVSTISTFSLTSYGSDYLQRHAKAAPVGSYRLWRLGRFKCPMEFERVKLERCSG
jgi:hypothetical protein